MKRFLGFSLVCMSAMFFAGCDSADVAPSDDYIMTPEEEAANAAYAKAQSEAADAARPK